MEEEKKIVYDIIVSTWGIVKKHGFEKMGEKEWEELIDETNKLAEKYKEKGTRYWNLYRRIAGNLIDYVEVMQKSAGGVK